MKQVKVILYPMAGAFQFVLACQQPERWVLYTIIGSGLIGLGILNLIALTKR